MKLMKLTVRNYRVLEKCEIDVADSLTVIVGKNNTGKTSIAGILGKFLGGSQRAGSFVYDDLNVHAKQNLFDAVSSSNPDNPAVSISLTVVISYKDDDSLRNIRPLLLDLTPTNHYVGVLFTYSMDDDGFSKCKSDYEQYLASVNKASTPSTQTLFDRFMGQRFGAYFKRASVPVYVNEDCIPNNKRCGTELKDGDLAKIIRFDCVDAFRTVSNKETSSALGKRISTYYRDFGHTKVEEASNRLMNSLLEMDSRLTAIYEELFQEISDVIKTFGGFQEGDMAPHVVSKLSDQDLLSNDTAVTYQSSDGGILPESHNGLGYMNLMSIVTDIVAKTGSMRHEADEVEPAEINILFVEEPEAHTHPQLQTIFIRHLKELIENRRHLHDCATVSIQCMLTTHSAHVVANADFNDMRYLVRQAEGLVAAKNLSDLKAIYDKKEDSRATYKFIRQYLTLDRADVFFADKLLLIEGDTECILMPSIMKKMDEAHAESTPWVPLLSQEISVISVGAHANIFLPLIEFLGLKALIVTDADFVGGEHNKACQYCDLKTTSNATIKRLLPKETASADKLQLLYSSGGLYIFKPTEGNGWQKSDEGLLCLTFQAKTTDSSTGEPYYPRSFEDAFIFENRSFLSKNIDSFKSLCSEAAKASFKDEEETPYDLAKTIEKKTSFAMDILLASQATQQEKSDEADWKIPSYIERGLAWLANA